MRKLSLVILVTLLASAYSWADCSMVYYKAANSRQVKTKYILIGATIASIFVTPYATAVIAGGLYYNEYSTDFPTLNNTYGKVGRTLGGEIDLVTNKIAKELKKKNIIINPEDESYQLNLYELIHEMNTQGKFCILLGYDNNFNDKFAIFKFSRFVKMVSHEYALRYHSEAK
jgi:hypothetical protein